MIYNIIKNYAIFDISIYFYHRIIHNFDFHVKHHEDYLLKNNNNDILDDVALISGPLTLIPTISYYNRGYITKNAKQQLFYWTLAGIMHPLLHKYDMKYPPLSYLKDRHMDHHKYPDTKFGPVTPCMDILFGTEY